jgi:predicted nucleotidyltransferase
MGDTYPVESEEHASDAIEATLKRAVAALRDSGVPFLLGGSLASWARGGPQTRHDLDLIVKREDAERALEALEEAGMRTERPPEEWLFKAWDGPVLVDLIFAPRGLAVTDELIERGDELHILGITIPVMALEDLLVTKLLALNEHALDYSGVLEIARALREQIDWAALRRRTAAHPYAVAFVVLVEELGIVPERSRRPGADVRVISSSARSPGAGGSPASS